MSERGLLGDIDSTPRPMIQETGLHGGMAWKVWVSCGLLEYAHEHGTYAWTRKGAERKALRLLRKYLRTRRSEPIEVATEPAGEPRDQSGAES